MKKSIIIILTITITNFALYLLLFFASFKMSMNAFDREGGPTFIESLIRYLWLISSWPVLYPMIIWGRGILSMFGGLWGFYIPMFVNSLVWGFLGMLFLNIVRNKKAAKDQLAPPAELI